MNKKIFISFVLCFFCISVFAQKSLNSYKYILVPRQFEFQNSQDKYQVNSLTKFLFNRAGFIAIFNDEKFPEDLANNSCLALKAVINENSGFFYTKMNLDLFDCYNVKVFSTTNGKSKSKEYKKAYHEAIRNTFKDLEALNYKYKPEKKLVITDKKPSILKIEEKATIKTKKKQKVTISKKQESLKIINTQSLNSNKSIEGKFSMGKWGECVISKTANNYSVVGGDEKFTFATIFKTSKLNLYIIKWAAYKQPLLLEVDNHGNLKVDIKDGIEIYKRIN